VSGGRALVMPVHGSPAGFDAGCDTKASCPNHGSPTMLTCAEAVVRRRGDYGAARLPQDQPLQRGLAVFRPATPSKRARATAHGTPWGYQRGCRARAECPHWQAGKITCADARRQYLADYKRRRREGTGSAPAHGTIAGYSAGCHDPAACPHADITCTGAWRAYKLGRSREAGSRARETVDPHEARIAVLSMRERGHSVRAIAEMAGVGRTTIGDLLRGGREPGHRRFCKDVVDRIVGVAADS
jgi:hypothetical protein